MSQCPLKDIENCQTQQVTLGLQRSLKRDTAYLNPVRPVFKVNKRNIIGKLTNGSNTVIVKLSNKASSIRNMKKIILKS